MKTETILGALIAALILFLTGTLALLQLPETSGIKDINMTAWVVLGIGASISFLKDYQALTTRRLLSNLTPGPSVNSHWLVGILAILVASSMLGSCTGTRAAYKAADGLDETAKVVSEHYYALVREANVLKDSGQLSGQELDTAQALVAVTAPAITDLATAAQAFAAVQNAQTEGDLQRAINDAAIAVSKLLDVIKAVTSTVSADGLFDAAPQLAAAA